MYVFLAIWTRTFADTFSFLVPQGNVKLYKSPFWKDFWHLNVAMMTSNNALVPDPDKEDILASAPTDWPFLYLGLRMCGWADNQIKYYLIGTPVIWWGSSISMIAGIFTLGFYLMRMQRQYQDWAPGEWENWLYVLKIAFAGWAFHYRECRLGMRRASVADMSHFAVPFLIMGRVTYLHHYVSAAPWMRHPHLSRMLSTSFPPSGSLCYSLAICWTRSSFPHGNVPTVKSGYGLASWLDPSCCVSGGSRRLHSV
jgi:hypothetical protein